MPSLSSLKPYDLVLVDGMNMMARMDWMDLSYNGSPTGMFYGTMNWLLQNRREMPSSRLVFLWEGRRSWRKAKYPHYKGNRAKRSTLGDGFFQRVEEVMRALVYAGAWQVSHSTSEADDLAGYFSQTREEQRVLLISKDRDWWQFVNDRVDVQYGNRTMTCDEVRSELKFDPWKLPLYKSLRGDPSDNIPAIPRFPTKLAEYAVAKADDYGSIVKAVRAKEPGWAKKLEAHKWQFDQNYELIKYNDAIIAEEDLTIIEPAPDMVPLANLLLRNGMDLMVASVEEAFRERNIR